MENGKISAQITKLADLLEFQGANSFKIRAYRRGARQETYLVRVRVRARARAN